MKHSLRDHWRISTFRLALLFGLVFILGNIALLSLVYWQTSTYLVQRNDNSILGMASNFNTLNPEQVVHEVQQALIYDLRRSNLYGLFRADGTPVAGNMSAIPAQLHADGKIHEFAQLSIAPYSSPASQRPAQPGLARALVQRLSDGSILIVGRDFTQLAEIKAIILKALLASGAIILCIGLLTGFALSISPLRRINAIRDLSRRIMQGELSLRMAVSNRQDELDMLASIVNTMLEEIERLLNEVKSVSDTLAHDLRTPLTRLRLTLHRAQQETIPEQPHHLLLSNALDETDTLLVRFRALLRISEIENRQRKSGFRQINAAQILEQLQELFEPLAEDAQISLHLEGNAPAEIYADPDLLFEALSNLVDNAIKFTAPGGAVWLRSEMVADALWINIIDTGCGIPAAEREAVLLRFQRSSKTDGQQGYGLGLSIVAAIVRLHGFNLQFQDTQTGTHLVIICPRRA